MKRKLDALYLLRFNGLTPLVDLQKELNDLNATYHETHKNFLEAFGDFSFNECHQRHAELVALNCKIEYILRMIESR